MEDRVRGDVLLNVVFYFGIWNHEGSLRWSRNGVQEEEGARNDCDVVWLPIRKVMPITELRMDVVSSPAEWLGHKQERDGKHSRGTGRRQEETQGPAVGEEGRLGAARAVQGVDIDIVLGWIFMDFTTDDKRREVCKWLFFLSPVHIF